MALCCWFASRFCSPYLYYQPMCVQAAGKANWPMVGFVLLCVNLAASAGRSERSVGAVYGVKSGIVVSKAQSGGY